MLANIAATNANSAKRGNAGFEVTETLLSPGHYPLGLVLRSCLSTRCSSGKPQPN